jgi:hypothetical protein
MALGSLEVELLSAILEYVDDESPNTSKSVSLVNKHLYATVRRVRFRHQVLDFAQPGKATSRLSALLAEPEALRSIRRLTIAGHVHSNPSELLAIRSAHESLTKLIRELANLRSLVWGDAGPIPLDVLDAIHQCQPKTALTIYNCSGEANHKGLNDPAGLALTHSPALKHFQAIVWNRGSDTGLDLREAICKRIIANAPNLQHASVTTSKSRMLPTEGGGELEEQEERFYTHKQPSRSLKSLTLDGYGLSKWTLDHWGRFVDFSKLESFKCSRGFVPDKSYFELAPEFLPSLKHLSLNFSLGNRNAAIAAAADHYLATCPPLETVSLWRWMNVVSLPSILKHGPTLKTLQLHERESDSTAVPRGLLRATDVADIRRACPILQDFTMDIDREAEEWEDEVNNQAIYDELSLFSLNRVQLYFSLGVAAQILVAAGTGTRARPGRRARSSVEDADASSDSESSESARGGPPAKQAKLQQKGLTATERAMLPLRTAQETVSEAKSIWRTIFGQRRTGARALDIKIGEWERKTSTGYPADLVMWERNNRSYLQLRPHERDDMLDEVVVTCRGGLEGKI